MKLKVKLINVAKYFTTPNVEFYMLQRWYVKQKNIE